MLNRVRTFLSKPQNVILLLMGIVLTASTVAPIVAIVQDTIKIHPGTIDEYLSGRSSGYTLANYIDLFTSPLAKRNLWEPLLNTIWLSVGSCAVAILYGGIFAFLITRTNLKARKYLSSIFIFPYIMPQWTLAVVWQHMFSSNAVTGTSNGLLASFGIVMPAWWCVGLFPSVVVLGLHYAPFAYILIGGIFRNMDANLEEAATILDTPKWKTMLRITIPMIKPAILSTILLVFGGAMGSYPVPHYLNLTTLSTKYVSMNDKYTGEASILAIIMMLFGVAIMFANQLSIRSRKNYTTVTGKSGQISKINLGKVGKYIIAVLLIVLTFFTSIFPIISFAFETFLPNPGDYSFLYTGDASNLTTKWWLTNENITENGMYGQMGILHNATIWRAYGGTILVGHRGHHDRLRGVQVQKVQGRQLRQLCGLPALPDAIDRRRSRVLRALLEPVHKPVQHVHAADHRRHDQVHPLRIQERAELHAPAVRRDRGGRADPERAVDQEDDADHHPDPEDLDPQRLPAAVHDLSERAQPVHAAVRAGLHTRHYAGLLRRDGAVRLLQRNQSDTHHYDPCLQHHREQAHRCQHRQRNRRLTCLR